MTVETKAKIKTKSRIFEAVHETAADLQGLGFIDKRQMQKMDALCLTPVQPDDNSSAKKYQPMLLENLDLLATLHNRQIGVLVLTRR